MITALILVYSFTIGVIRPYDKCIHNAHLILIQVTKIFIAAGVSIKQYLLWTHHKMELNYELIWAWVVVALLAAIDFMAIMRIYMLIKLKQNSGKKNCSKDQRGNCD